jgi:hypothetical protein
VLEQQLLDARVAVLPRRVDRPEAAALWQVRVGPVLEREVYELVPCRLVLAFRCGRGMDRGRLNVLVSRKRIHVCAPFEQEPCGIRVAEEAGQAKWVKAVVAEGVRAGWIIIQQVTQALGPSQRCRLEDVELRIGRKELLDLFAVTSVQRRQQFGQLFILS